MSTDSSIYRDRDRVLALVDAIRSRATRPWTLMEVCGGQTHAILRNGIDELLGDSVQLLHGPGCPVCVTDASIIDDACTLALNHGVILCTFGDMLRVPGHHGSLMEARSRGADVRVVYSPLDALAVASRHPGQQVVFLAVGFETTAPANALAVQRAASTGIGNFSLLLSQVMVPPALDALLATQDQRIDGFLAAGHVCTVMGYHQYHAVTQRYGVPVVVTGFEPVDLLRGILACVDALESARHEVFNLYERYVSDAGNPHAQALLATVFQPVDRVWRGLGMLLQSGLGLSETYAAFDASRRFCLDSSATAAPLTVCISGKIMQGLVKPPQCPAFARECTPEHPLGATMVSTEGACNAYFQYRFTPA